MLLRSAQLVGLPLTIASAALLLVNPVAAQTPVNSDAPAVTVSAADLNLGRKADAKIMVQRIESAADSVCGEKLGRYSARDYQAYRECLDQSVGQAITKLNNSLVSEVAANGHAEQVGEAALKVSAN